MYRKIAWWAINKCKKTQADICCPRCRLWYSFVGGTFMILGDHRKSWYCGHCLNKSVWDFATAPKCEERDLTKQEADVLRDAHKKSVKVIHSPCECDALAALAYEMAEMLKSHHKYRISRGHDPYKRHYEETDAYTKTDKLLSDYAAHRAQQEKTK